MRVFCPEHRKGFFAPRQSPIRCENRGHVLGKLDFEGEAKSPVEIEWRYCCNCEHFCPVAFSDDGLERCPVCTRRTSLLYLCNRCFTISFESSTPLQTKNFTINADGAPHPSCPGCLQATAPDLHEHACDEISATFVTALNSCPLCGERLDVGPQFPSSVATYLKKTRAANKVNVTFDYETELFVPVDDGEFVLIDNGADNVHYVLPRASRLANRRDFYEFYQDYYHCSKPETGEIQVIEPASVIALPKGWQLQSTGVLEVVEDRLQKRSQVAVNPLHIEERARMEDQRVEEVTPKVAVITEEPVELEAEEPEPELVSRGQSFKETACPKCGAMVEERYSFCWKCGASMSSVEEKVADNPQPPVIRKLSIDEIEDEEELTVQHDESASRPAPFSWALPITSKNTQPVFGSALKLIAVALVGVLMSVAFFLFTRPASSAITTTSPQQEVSATDQKQPVAQPAQSQPVTSQATATQSPQQSSTRPDDELKKLREKRLSAKSSERPEILRTFVRAEREYPDDYRFPYERAKLSINSSDKNSRDAAFAALSLAAGKAIKTGKAPEMLESLKRDSNGDFQKLARGRREWVQLQEALKTKDPKVLNTRMGL